MLIIYEIPLGQKVHFFWTFCPQYANMKFMDTTLQELRNAVRGEVFDNQILMYSLRKYKKPRDKISSLLKNESIIQIKKGIYIFGASYRRGHLSLETVASMLVQPSYISREFALHKYGLLPERIETVTSMTTKKKKTFDTHLGRFDYYSLNYEKFGIGVQMKTIANEGGYLFATKEKALVDWIASIPPIPNRETLRFFLYEESRIEEAALLPLNRRHLEEIVKIYHNRNATLLLTL